jgi:hypothetical protein
MAEEVRIVATLDSSDIDNGVKRVGAAAQRIKQVVEDSTQADPAKAGDSGAAAGNAFANGFIKRLVIRDAIYTMLRGLSQVASDVGQDIANALGAALPKGGFLAGFEKWIADGVFSILEGLWPGLAKKDAETRKQNIQELQSDEEQRFRNTLYQQDPTTFKKATSTVEDQLNIQYKAISDAKIANQKFHEAWAEFQSATMQPEGITESAGAYYLRTHKEFKAPSGAMNDEVLAGVIADREKAIKQLEFEKGIAEKRDSIVKAEDKKEAAAEAKEEKAEAAADKKEETAEAKQKREAAEAAKKAQELSLGTQITGDEGEQRTAEKTLDFTKRQLEHEKATSVVSIGGQLFGRNDSAAQMVNYAARQLNRLDSIDNEIKALRKERGDLTLL